MPTPGTFRHSDYERGRYQALVEAIGDRQYAAAFEPGCANGELTAMLAPLCDAIEAIDCSPAAVDIARGRCRTLPGVEIWPGALPDDLPGRSYDLIVFSEIGYYFDSDDLGRLIRQLWSRLVPGGRLIACHWLGHSEDHRLHGQEVAAIMADTLPVSEDFHARHPGFLLQRWSKPE